MHNFLKIISTLINTQYDHHQNLSTFVPPHSPFNLKLLHINSLPRPALELLDKMLTLDPARRISAKECLVSSWLVDIHPQHITPPKFVMVYHYGTGVVIVVIIEA